MQQTFFERESERKTFVARGIIRRKRPQSVSMSSKTRLHTKYSALGIAIDVDTICRCARDAMLKKKFGIRSISVKPRPFQPLLLVEYTIQFTPKVDDHYHQPAEEAKDREKKSIPETFSQN